MCEEWDQLGYWFTEEVYFGGVDKPFKATFCLCVSFRWDVLEVQTNDPLNDSSQAYAAGVAEAAVTQRVSTKLVGGLYWLASFSFRS